MIQHYCNIAAKLKEVPGLATIDLIGSGDVKIYPAAFVHLQNIEWTSASRGAATATLPFTLQVVLDPKLRSGSNAPTMALLQEKFQIIEDIKNKMEIDGCEAISGITLIGEELRKENGSYVQLLHFEGAITKPQRTKKVTKATPVVHCEIS